MQKKVLMLFWTFLPHLRNGLQHVEGILPVLDLFTLPIRPDGDSLEEPDVVFTQKHDGNSSFWDFVLNLFCMTIKWLFSPKCRDWWCLLTWSLLLLLLSVMNSAELPLDPNLQTSNLLITFLKYSSIVMQDTKGKCDPAELPIKSSCLSLTQGTFGGGMQTPDHHRCCPGCFKVKGQHLTSI